jgi:hypothetical protein
VIHTEVRWGLFFDTWISLLGEVVALHLEVVDGLLDILNPRSQGAIVARNSADVFEDIPERPVKVPGECDFKHFNGVSAIMLTAFSFQLKKGKIPNLLN